MYDEVRKSRTIKVKPSILRKAHIAAIESRKRLGQWVEEAIEEKIEREGKESYHISQLLNRGKDLVSVWKRPSMKG